MIKRTLMAILLVILFVEMGCDPRELSIQMENGYINDHPPEEVSQYFKDVPYVEIGGEELTLDISVPVGSNSDELFPVLMIIHGGGWMMHTNTIMEGMARYITNRGYVVFNINYRVLPHVEMEQIVEDCFGALIWIKEHAGEYNGDPDRIAVTGDSAGGHLTAMIVTQGDNPEFTPSYPGNSSNGSDHDMSVTCAIPTYGIFNFVEMPQAGSIIGETFQEAPERHYLLSPHFQVRQDLPPQLVMVGDLDFLFFENINYVISLMEVGAPIELWVSHLQTHAFLNNYWDESGQNGYDRMIEFMDKHLKNGQTPAE